jgi:hypothetical protein
MRRLSEAGIPLLSWGSPPVPWFEDIVVRLEISAVQGLPLLGRSDSVMLQKVEELSSKQRVLQ